ncbi:MAG: hypothetical protein GWP08_17455 [Nitrospiraceae bacterium]|nr:hypothetical protein [Nitrospiraceae bacterium]
MSALPTVPLGGEPVTRLIVGGNPFRGNSHRGETMSRDMESYFTVERIKQTLFACERAGINTVQARGDAMILACIREYWAEGGTMRFIVQTASELRDLHGHVRHLARFGALAVYVHGTFTDRRYLQGDLSEVVDLAKTIRDAGVAVGIGTHIPEVIQQVEEQAWDVDFYMACLYNINRECRESALVGGQEVDEDHLFDHDDRFKMLDTIRQTPKTCLAFKLLGAGRLCESPAQVRKAFATAYGGIKPKDACVVGMFPKYGDQIGENVQHVREVLAGDSPALNSTKPGT